MSFTYLERQELNALSKEVFGKTSTWYNKVYKKGIKNKDTNKINMLPDFNDIKAHLLEVQANTNKLLEEMKASQNGNSI